VSARVPGLFDGFSLAAFAPLHLNPDEINDFILIHGACGEYRKGFLCPCSRLETGLASAGCEVCHGVGYIHPEKDRHPLVFLDHSRQAQFRFRGVGSLADGTIAITFPSGIVPGRGDLILPDHEVVVVHEQFHRDVQQATLRTLADRRLVPEQDHGPFRPRPARLLYPSVTEVEALHWIHEDRLVEAHAGVDYRIRAGRIEWLPGVAPDVGEGFSVRYTAPAAYMVAGNMPNYRTEGGRALPWSVTAQQLAKVQRGADLR